MNEDGYDGYIMKIYLPSFCEGCKEFKFDELKYYAWGGEHVESDYTCANMKFCKYLRKLWSKKEEK